MSVPERASTPTIGAYLWFAAMAGMWAAFAALAVFFPATLADIWAWIRGLSLVPELLVWIAAFPGVLGLAVWESSLSRALRVVLVLVFGIGWTFASVPRPRARPTSTRPA